MENKRIMKETYFKLSLRLKTPSEKNISKYFSLMDILDVILGALFFLSIFLISSNEVPISSKLSEFNLLTVLILSLFIIQKENFTASYKEKQMVFLCSPLSKKEMRSLDIILNLVFVFKHVLLFQTVFIIYNSFIFGGSFLISSLLSIIPIVCFSYFMSEIFKILIFIIGSKISFVYKMKDYFLTFIFTILFYIVSHNMESINDWRFLPTNLLNSLYSFSVGTRFLTNDFILLTSIVVFLGFANLIVFPRVNIEIEVKQSNKITKYKNKKTYQEDAINNIVNSVIKNDQYTSVIYLEQGLKLISNTAWTFIVLSLTGIYNNSFEVIVIASIMALSSSGKQILSFMYSQTPGSLEYFEILDKKSNQNISVYAMKKVLFSKLGFVFLPLLILTLTFGVFYSFSSLWLIVINYIFVFLGSIFINYRYLLKHKPFFYSKTDSARPEELLPNLVSILIFLYCILIFPLLNFNSITFIILPVLYAIPAVLILFDIVSNKYEFDYPFVKQRVFNDCGVACFKMICEYYQKPKNPNWDNEYGKNKYYGTSFKDIMDMGTQVGLYMVGYSIDDYNVLFNNRSITPYIAQMKIRNISHFIVVYEAQSRRLIIGDPGTNRVKSIKKSSFLKKFNGYIIFNEEVSTLL